MIRNRLQNIAGTIWLGIGTMLMARGARYLWLAVQNDGVSSTAVATSVGVGLAVGLAKGRFVLARTALKNKRRIAALPEPVRGWQVYSLAYLPLIGLMMGMGIGLRSLFRGGFAGGMVTYGGGVIGIGAALFLSAFVYWFEGAFGSLPAKIDAKIEAKLAAKQEPLETPQVSAA